MANKDLNLNSVSRYSKSSPQFVLEEHGHCEVPAGCGGVVLRWVNPVQTIPIELWLHFSGTGKFFLDGAVPSSGRPLIKYGTHVISLQINEFVADKGFLMFAGVFEEEKMIHKSFIGPKDSYARAPILSEPDGSWKYSVNPQQDDSWMQAGFDDSDWKPLTPMPLPEPNDRQSYRYKKLLEFGAQELGAAGQHPNAIIQVRKVFYIEPPEAG